MLEFSIEEASSKVRTGPPLDDENDYGLRVWAGVLPLAMKSRPPIPDGKLVEGVTLPEYVQRYDARIDSHKADHWRVYGRPTGLEKIDGQR